MISTMASTGHQRPVIEHPNSNSLVMEKLRLID